MLRDAGGGFPSTTFAPLLARPPLQSEPSPATVGSPEITDEEIGAATAACCRICLESESEPGEPPPQLADGVPYPCLLVCAKGSSVRATAAFGSVGSFACLWVMVLLSALVRWIGCLDCLLRC